MLFDMQQHNFTIAFKVAEEAGIPSLLVSTTNNANCILNSSLINN